VSSHQQRDLHRPDHDDPGSNPRGEAGALACVRCRRPLRRATRHQVGPDPRGRVWVAFKRWPEGWVCSGCYAAACETYGLCGACGRDRLLPGIGADGRRRCTDCAGLGNFTCSRCREEGWLHSRGAVCGRCVLKDRLAVALDDGTGRVRPELVPIFDLVVSMERPRAGILWLSRAYVPPLLRALAQGEVPLTHEGIATLSPVGSATYVRDLLVSAQVLAPVDRFLFGFEQWLPAWLDQIADPDHRQLLHAYANWRLLRDLRAISADGPIGHYRDQIARRRLRVAASFLSFLHGRCFLLAGCTQPALDEWFAQATAADRALQRHFLRWARETQRMPMLQLPLITANTPTPITQQERLEWIRRIYAGEGMDLTERVVALLVLLYAQPLTKVARLTVDDITVVDGQMLLRLGDPPAPVPPPFDDLLSQHLAARPNLMTATNPNSRWLFPGRRAGEPMHPTTFRLRFQKLGIPNLTGRSRALRAMLLQAPPAVVAGMLGYRPDKAEEIARGAGATWKRYAAGSHDRSRLPIT
jgi:hypothetical protein